MPDLRSKQKDPSQGVGSFERQLCQASEKDPSHGASFECQLYQATEKDKPVKLFEQQLPEATKKD